MCIKADDFFLPKNRLLLRMPVLFLLGGKTLSLIKIENLTFAYGGGENLFENVSLSLDTNWRTGLIGRNGRAFMGGDAVANKLWTKNFTIITLGTVVSLFGSSMTGFAISLLVLDYLFAHKKSAPTARSFYDVLYKLSGSPASGFFRILCITTAKQTICASSVTVHDSG
jgi:hypothetical protein